MLFAVLTAPSAPLSDGLTDCMDPDCCIQSPCQNSPLCRGSRDPLLVIQQNPMSQPRVRSFYDRVKMLVGRDSTHIIPGENPFNSRYGREPKRNMFSPNKWQKGNIFCFMLMLIKIGDFYQYKNYMSYIKYKYIK